MTDSNVPRKNSGTSYTTNNLKKALVSARVRRALDELRESRLILGSDIEILKLLGEAHESLNRLLSLLEKES